MNNPVSYAIEKIKWKIPGEILDKVFIPRGRHRYMESKSIDAIIRDKVIESRVMVECDLVGSKQIPLPIHSSWVQQLSTAELIIRVPKSATQGRAITRAISLTYGTVGMISSSNYNSNYEDSVVMSGIRDVLNTALPTPVISSPIIEPLGENMFLVQDMVISSMPLYMNCFLEADSNFNHLSKPTWRLFGDLCVLACKSYIWTNSMIMMDSAERDGGSELGRWAEIVDSYSDADEQYEDMFRAKWRRAAILNDPISKRKHIRSLVGKI